MVEIERIRRLLQAHGERFRSRCYSPRELALAGPAGPQEARVMAGQWAAKEAFLKAVGTPLSGTRLREIEVLSDTEGAARLRLHGAAGARLRATSAHAAYVSVGSTRELATAIVVLA